MCFSSAASFSVGAAVSAIGVATVRQVKKPGQYAFASFPLIFGVQQFAEGFVWLSLSDPAFARYQAPAVFTFLAFALVIWPTLVPAAILLFEKNAKVRRWLYGLLVLGGGVSVYLLYVLFYCPIDVRIEKYHILYDIAFRHTPMLFYSGLYFVAAVGPLLLSETRKIRWYGFSATVSYGLTKFFLEEFVISVWCFFAAVLSVIIYLIVREAASPLKKTDSATFQYQLKS